MEEFENKPDNGKKDGSRRDVAKSAIVMVFLIVILVIIILGIRGCSIQKKVESPGTMGVAPGESTGVVVTERNTEKFVSEENNMSGVEIVDGADEGISKESELDTETPTEEEVVSSNEPITENAQVSEGTSDNSSEVTLKKVDSMDIVEKYSSDALISSKSIYLSDDGSYVYSLSLLIPLGEGYRSVEYMCSVSSWKAVEMNESISVEYGMDNNGNIIILSLMKHSSD